MSYFYTAILLLLVICLIVIVCDTNRFVIKKYEFKNSKVTGTFRFVFISDLHNKSFGKENKKLIQAIDEIAPDAILCAGDILTAKPGQDFQIAAKLMNCLAETYPVYYGNGNHEHRLKLYPETYGSMAEEYEKALTKKNIFRLVNESRDIKEKNIVIYGLEIGKEYYKRFQKEPMGEAYISSLLGDISEEACTILIAHNPDYFSQYSDYGADFILAGHVHGGVVRIPFLGGMISPSLKIFPKYDGGVFQENKKNGRVSTMILSRGLGCHTIPVRFFNPGELIEITISHI